MRHEPVRQRTRIHFVQAGALALVPAFFIAQPHWQGAAHELMEITGVCLIFLCIVGRMWSILYVGSKKNRELVMAGPYSMTRNPLYFFSSLGAVGIGLIYGSLVIALALALLVYGILTVTAAKESNHLRSLFGPQYEAYERRTPSFWPRASLYREASELNFSPKALMRTFKDGLLFLAAFPAIETIEYLQQAGYIPVLIQLY